MIWITILVRPIILVPYGTHLLSTPWKLTKSYIGGKVYYIQRRIFCLVQEPWIRHCTQYILSNREGGQDRVHTMGYPGFSGPFRGVPSTPGFRGHELPEILSILIPRTPGFRGYELPEIPSVLRYPGYRHLQIPYAVPYRALPAPT